MTRVVLASLASCLWLRGQAAPQWPDTYVARLQALALMQTLNAEILSSHSATRTLEGWCRSHHLANEPQIIAEVVKGAEKQASADQRKRLQVSPEDEVRHRRVRLRCGENVLSEADNWYVPSRLTSEMNRLLETTTTPFGRAVQSLDPYRQTLSVKLLWSPLPEGWENGIVKPEDGPQLVIPDSLFEHRAILYTRDHKPFSLVEETYKRQVLAFPPPK